MNVVSNKVVLASLGVLAFCVACNQPSQSGRSDRHSGQAAVSGPQVPDGGVPMNPPPQGTFDRSRRIQSLSEPVSHGRAAQLTEEFLTKVYGRAGTRVRTFSTSVKQLREKSPALFNSTVAEFGNVIVVEHRGVFRSEGGRSSSGAPNWAYACLVIDPETGLLVNRSLYNEDARP